MNTIILSSCHSQSWVLKPWGKYINSNVKCQDLVYIYVCTVWFIDLIQLIVIYFNLLYLLLIAHFNTKLLKGQVKVLYQDKDLSEFKYSKEINKPFKQPVNI